MFCRTSNSALLASKRRARESPAGQPVRHHRSKRTLVAHARVIHQPRRLNTKALRERQRTRASSADAHCGSDPPVADAAPTVRPPRRNQKRTKRCVSRHHRQQRGGLQPDPQRRKRAQRHESERKTKSVLREALARASLRANRIESWLSCRHQRCTSTTNNISTMTSLNSQTSAGTAEPQERPQSAREGLHPGGADDRDCDCWHSLSVALPSFP